MVVIVFEGVRESEGVVVPLEAKVVTLIVVHVIIDVFADTVPANAILLLDFLREGKDLHSVVVERIWFHQIQHVELHSHTLCGIANSKKVPLRVPVGVYVILQNQIVLCLGDLDGR